jgi:hypothetical protein
VIENQLDVAHLPFVHHNTIGRGNRTLGRWAGGPAGGRRIDLLGYGLFLPLLPYYAEAPGATPTLVGLLVASNALFQLTASPIDRCVALQV